MYKNIIKVYEVLGSFSRVNINFLKLHMVVLAGMGQSGVYTTLGALN